MNLGVIVSNNFSKDITMADIKDLNSYTFPSGQKLVDISHEDYDKWFKNTDPWVFKYYGTEEEITKVNEYAKDVENNYKEYQKLSTPENHKKLLNSYIDYDVYGRFIVANHVKPNATDLIKEKNSREANGERIAYDDKKYQIFDVNVINYPKGYDDWLEQKNKELEKQIQQQLLKEQEKEDVQTTITLNSMTNDIVIEPYSRKPEDIESMKFFVAKVSGESIENITNQQSQAFIDNLGTPYEDYLTVKTDGTFEHTHNSAYSSEISKTTEPKKILSIIDDYAEEHSITNASPKSDYNYEFIHSVSENINEIEKKMMEQLFNQSTNIVDTNSFGYMELDDEGEHYSYYREIKYNEEKNTFIEKTTEEHWDKAYPYTKKNYYLYSPKEMFENHSFDFDDESVNKKFKDFVYEKYNKSLKSENIQSLQAELDIWISKAEADNKEISRLNSQLETANNTIQKLEKIIKEQDELLNGKGSVKVNGVERKFEHGLKQAFPEAVKRIDIENQRNKELTADYNKLLKSQNQNISPKSPGDDSSWSD